MAVEFALSEDRQKIIELPDLLNTDTLDDAAFGSKLGLPSLEVGNVDRIGLGDEAIDRSRSIEVLHCYLEAEVRGRLITDRLHHRIGNANVAQLDVLDLLRPDRRETRDRTGAGRAAQQRAAGFQERTPRRTFLCSGAILESTLPAGLPVLSGVLLMTVSLRATIVARIAEIGCGVRQSFLSVTGVASLHPSKKLEI